MSTEKGSSLFLIMEGGLHSLDYMHRNGVYPKEVGLRTGIFQDRVPYLTSDTDILVVVKGLTDFTVKGIYSLLKEIRLHEDKLKSVAVMSNVHLGDVPFPYYLYEGDLFYGTVKKVVRGKITSFDTPEKDKKKVKSTRKGKPSVDNLSINAVMERYKIYNQRDILPSLYGTDELELLHTKEDKAYSESIVLVNVFPEN